MRLRLLAIAGGLLVTGIAPSAASAESIIGRTHDPSDTPVNGVCVEAFSVDQGSGAPPVATTFSDLLFQPNGDPGRFTLNVPPGSYKLRFAGCGGSPNGDVYQPEF